MTTTVKKKKNLRPKFHVRRGDIVKVVTGEHKGSQGKILEVQTKKQRVIVEGVRLIKKHARRSNDNPTGGIIEREGGIHVSNVKLVERPADAEAKGKSK
jgi:large subunit ribosomal protein L24